MEVNISFPEVITKTKSPPHPSGPLSDFLFQPFHVCIYPVQFSRDVDTLRAVRTALAAGYWINRYTVLDISRLLRDRSLTFVMISDMFGFSSPAYFSRYVQQHLDMSPTEYRG